MTLLWNGLSDAKHHEDALLVGEAQLSMLRRISTSGYLLLVVQSNLANTYQFLGRHDDALRMRRDVYSGFCKWEGEEHETSITAANNYAATLKRLNRHDEVKTLMRKTLPVARRVLSESNELTLKMRWNYAMALYRDSNATLDDFRAAATTLEETTQAARRVLGGAHPVTEGTECALQEARAALHAREESVRLRDELAAAQDKAAAARAASDAINAELEALRLENARAALRTRETPPPPLRRCRA